MLVRELIELLRHLDQDALVLTISGNSDYLVEITDASASAQNPTYYSVFSPDPDPTRSPFDQITERAIDKAVILG